MEKSFVELVRQTLKDAHDSLEGTMNDVTEEAAHWQPQGKALPLAVAYGHVIVSEDMILNGWIRKSKLLIDQGWSDKMGLNLPHPAMDADWEKNFVEWSKKLKMDLKKFKEYAQAVYKQSDDYLAGLTDKDLFEQKIDLSVWGLGDWTLGRFILRFMISHVDNLTGEISAVKGLQGLKGYPF